MATSKCCHDGRYAGEKRHSLVFPGQDIVVISERTSQYEAPPRQVGRLPHLLRL
jgi:hypothetical protein